MKKHETEVATSSKVQFHESEDEDDDPSSEEEAYIEHELADLSFEELQRARSDGTVALHRKSKSEEKTGRPNKNRPMEISSKKPVSRYRQVVQAPKRMTLDPRFETLYGKLEPDGFRKRYNFLFEEHLPTEKAELQNQLKKSTDPEAVQEMKSRIAWIDKQLKAGSTKRNESQILSAHKKKEREAAKQGKQPFYLKKSEIRKQRLVEKYEILKAAGKLDSYIEKRRKRNAAKDHRFMPYDRRSKEKE